MNEPHPAVRQRRPNLIVRHWRGDCSLAVSYWLNGLLAGVALLLVAVAITAMLHETRQPWLYLVALLLIWSFATLATVWQIVGVWRSAARTRRIKRTRFWPVAAQIMMVLAALNMLRTVVSQAAPAIKDAVAYVDGDPELGVHGVRILRAGSEIEISGPFTWGLAQQFTAALAAAPQAHVVHLDSIGGRIGVALSVRDIIVAHRLDTYVSQLCASACTLVFLAGTKRWLGPNGRLGFHSGSAAGGASRFANISFRQYYEQDGLPAAFLNQVFRTTPRNLWFPTVPELIAAHVVTDRAPDGLFAVSGFGPHPDLAKAARALLKLPIYAALRKTDPDWPELLALWDRTIVTGQPITAFGAEARAHIVRATRTLLPVAPIAAVRELALVMQAEIETLQQEDPDICWAYLHNGRIDLPRYLSAKLLAADAAATARLLNDATDTAQKRLSGEQHRIGIARVLAELRAEGLEPASTLADLRPGAPHAAFCPAWLDLLRAARAAPADDAGSPLRALLSPG